MTPDLKAQAAQVFFGSGDDAATEENASTAASTQQEPVEPTVEQTDDSATAPESEGVDAAIEAATDAAATEEQPQTEPVTDEPETQPAAEEQTPGDKDPAEPASDDSEESFLKDTKLDPSTLPEEVKPFYDLMNRHFHKRNREFSEQSKELESVKELATTHGDMFTGLFDGAESPAQAITAAAVEYARAATDINAAKALVSELQAAIAQHEGTGQEAEAPEQAAGQSDESLAALPPEVRKEIEELKAFRQQLVEQQQSSQELNTQWAEAQQRFPDFGNEQWGLVNELVSKHGGTVAQHAQTIHEFGEAQTAYPDFPDQAWEEVALRHAVHGGSVLAHAQSVNKLLSESAAQAEAKAKAERQKYLKDKETQQPNVGAGGEGAPARQAPPKPTTDKELRSAAGAVFGIEG